MLRVVKDLAPVLFEKRDSVADHGEIFLEAHAEHFLDVQGPCLAHHGDHGRCGIEQLAHLGVILDSDPAAAGHTERDNLRMLPIAPGRLGEELGVFRIRARPAALDVVHPEFIEPLGHTEFVLHAERNTGALRAVTQGRVVDRHSGLLAHTPMSGQATPRLKPRFANR